MLLKCLRWEIYNLYLTYVRFHILSVYDLNICLVLLIVLLFKTVFLSTLTLVKIKVKH